MMPQSKSYAIIPLSGHRRVFYYHKERRMLSVINRGRGLFILPVPRGRVLFVCVRCVSDRSRIRDIAYPHKFFHGLTVSCPRSYEYLQICSCSQERRDCVWRIVKMRNRTERFDSLHIVDGNVQNTLLCER